MLMMTARELAVRLSQFVWEHVTDFMEEGSVSLDSGSAQRLIAGRAVDVDELLIYFLWVHTWTVQQSFGGRMDADAVKAVLDATHRQVFSDMEQHGITPNRLPLFEQIMSARYAEYYAAAKGETAKVGRVAAAYVDRADESGQVADALAAALAQAAVDVGGPLRDFLQDVDIIREPALAN